MDDYNYKFDIPNPNKSIIKVIGVGGGGSNAVNYMYDQGIKDVEFIICNTDLQALNRSPVPIKLQLGSSLTQGLGAGANPNIGEEAAQESKDEVRQALADNTKMVFVTAGMGGGTGTGAAPVIAAIAKDMDILTVGIVTVPFGFEGPRKMQQAVQGIELLRQSCDTVIVILNDKLKEVYANLTMRKAFSHADDVLLTAAKGIAEIITVSTFINVDFEDVKTTLRNSGVALMGSAEVEGEDRALKAAGAAISSPLLVARDIRGAKKILLTFNHSEEDELQMSEFDEITEFIRERTGAEADLIWGQGIDETLGSALRVTIIATGFECDEEENLPLKGLFPIDKKTTTQVSTPFLKPRTTGANPFPPKPTVAATAQEVEKKQVHKEANCAKPSTKSLEAIKQQPTLFTNPIETAEPSANKLKAMPMATPKPFAFPFKTISFNDELEKEVPETKVPEANSVKPSDNDEPSDSFTQPVQSESAPVDSEIVDTTPEVTNNTYDLNKDSLNNENNFITSNPSESGKLEPELKIQNPVFEIIPSESRKEEKKPEVKQGTFDFEQQRPTKKEETSAQNEENPRMPETTGGSTFDDMVPKVTEEERPVPVTNETKTVPSVMTDRVAKQKGEFDRTLKEEQLRKEKMEREQRFARGELSTQDSNRYDDMFELPSYQRNNVKLHDVTHSSQESLSRFSLNGDNKISKNNPYLHDKPD